SHGVIASESAHAGAATSDASGETPSSRAHSHIPAAASRTFAAAMSVYARASGSAEARRWSGEKAAEVALAARGVLLPFQRSRSGSSPSRHAARAALSHGANWVIASSRFGLRGAAAPGTAHGGID